MSKKQIEQDESHEIEEIRHLAIFFSAQAQRLEDLGIKYTFANLAASSVVFGLSDKIGVLPSFVTVCALSVAAHIICLQHGRSHQLLWRMHFRSLDIWMRRVEPVHSEIMKDSQSKDWFEGERDRKVMDSLDLSLKWHEWWKHAILRYVNLVPLAACLVYGAMYLYRTLWPGPQL